MGEPIVLESNQNHATITDSGICPTLSASMGMGGGYVPMIVVYGVTTKGNGDAFINEQTHTSLSIGGGQAGQGYPCVLVVKDDEDTNREKILLLGRR